MALYIEKIIMHNRAPFEHLELNLKESGIVLLSAYNGGGKTTILSHIADAFYEMAKTCYSEEFEKNADKYYRLSSSLFSLDLSKPSIVYIRFVLDGEKIDYVDIREKCTREQYNEAININDRIDFEKIERNLIENNHLKEYFSELDKTHIQKVFETNIATYFPAYRFDWPGYLNDEYKNVKFNTKIKYSGYLPNRIEVVDAIQPLTDWMMDVLLDWQINGGTKKTTLQPDEKSTIDTTPEELKIWNLLNRIIDMAVINKEGGKLRLGIGRRNNSGMRISIMRDCGEKSFVKYPSIYNISSGEMSVLSIFGEVLHQADTISCVNDVSGIVLIDEIDKHLHMLIQKQVLPRLIAFFPNIQFIISSHSPFTTIGLSSSEQEKRTEMFVLSRQETINSPLMDNPIFEDAYKTMISENERYAREYAEECKRLNEIIKANTKPIIVTEGKTDWMHLEAALKALEIADIDVDFDKFVGCRGNRALMQYIKNLAMFEQPRKVVAVFDRDDESMMQMFENNEHHYYDYGNNVFAFVIPIANESEYGSNISIEHYYKKKDLLKEYEGRRLFLGTEFFETGNSRNGLFHTPIKCIKNKCKVNGIIDDKVYKKDDLQEECSIALSKAKFAENIYNKTLFAEGFDFSEFNRIFDIIREIQNL